MMSTTHEDLKVKRGNGEVRTETSKPRTLTYAHVVEAMVAAPRGGDGCDAHVVRRFAKELDRADQEALLFLIQLLSEEDERSTTASFAAEIRKRANVGEKILELLQNKRGTRIVETIARLRTAAGRSLSAEILRNIFRLQSGGASSLRGREDANNHLLQFIAPVREPNQRIQELLRRL